jgi:hypothetical protein
VHRNSWLIWGSFVQSSAKGLGSHRHGAEALEPIAFRVAGSRLTIGDKPAARRRLSERRAQMVERVLICFDTRLVIGHYFFDDADGLVTVRTEHGSKTNQIGKYAPKLLAELMLRELAEEGKA